jgi:hypothetical protein
MLNPLIDGISGFVRRLPSINDIIDFSGNSVVVGDDTLICLDDEARQISVVQFGAGDELSGINSLVLYPDGSTWEGMIGKNVPDEKAMLWSPTLARLLKIPLISPWKHTGDWKAVPTAALITNVLTGGCAQIEHTCGKQCE